MSRESPLGTHKERKKTSMWLPIEPYERASALSELLGIPLNAIFTMALCQWLASIAPILDRKTSRAVLDAVETQFQQVMEHARRR